MQERSLALGSSLGLAELPKPLKPPRVSPPRLVPHSLDEWRQERFQRQFAQGSSYWCYVNPGTYAIGGWFDSSTHEVTLPGFWIGRFPVTCDQYAPFVEPGYAEGARRWWTPSGWAWRQATQRSQPWGWNRAPYAGPGQPVVGVSWYEARAWSSWLNEQIFEQLPADYELRLPTEAEWEVAAAYPGSGERRTYPWGEQEPSLAHALCKDRSGSPLHPLPLIGSCPNGAAGCGAQDMAGGVWEWAASRWADYPAGAMAALEDSDARAGELALRGGSLWNDRIYMRCSARDRARASNAHYGLGFRVVVAPQG